MTAAATAIQDFSTSNPIYANAIVTAYTVDGSGNKTTTLAPLYASISGSTLSANPQTLDMYGKYQQPVYINVPVILSVTGLKNTPSHDTGIIAPVSILSGAGSPTGVIAATVGTLYLRTDGGAGTTLYVKESATDSSGWAAK